MGELVNLVITAYTDATFSDAVKVAENYKAWVNPDSYQESVTLSYNDCQPLGSSGNDPKYEKTIPEALTFKILFDSTGVFPQGNSATDGNTNTAEPSTSAKKKEDQGITTQITNFRKLTFHMNGSIHEPNYLKVNWGPMNIQCRVKKIDIDYKLFNPSGYPIRAFVTLTLEKILSKDEQMATENKKSPDLTRIYITKAGDTLPLLCYSIYGDSKYYIEVAKVNKIRAFRSLTLGEKIVFPPLQKSGK